MTWPSLPWQAPQTSAAKLQKKQLEEITGMAVVMDREVRPRVRVRVGVRVRVRVRVSVSVRVRVRVVMGREVRPCFLFPSRPKLGAPQSHI